MVGSGHRLELSTLFRGTSSSSFEGWVLEQQVVSDGGFFLFERRLIGQFGLNAEMSQIDASDIAEMTI
jgi:hypothetical protein